MSVQSRYVFTVSLFMVSYCLCTHDAAVHPTSHILISVTVMLLLQLYVVLNSNVTHEVTHKLNNNKSKMFKMLVSFLVCQHKYTQIIQIYMLLAETYFFVLTLCSHLRYFCFQLLSFSLSIFVFTQSCHFLTLYFLILPNFVSIDL